MASEDYPFSKHLRQKGGYLCCEGVRIKSIQDTLAQQLDQPSPIFVYSKQQLIDNINAYKSILGRWKVNYLLGYSMKANYNPWVLRTAVEQGCTPVTVSGHETQLALDNVTSPSHVVVNGNGKQSWEIDLAVDHGCLINVDSEFDLSHISVSAQRLKKTARILLRLNPDIDSQVHPYLATGLAASKFGLEENELDGRLDMISREPYLDLVGLHCHIGSTIDNVHVFSECLDVMLDKLDYVKEKGFNNLQYLNLGGGLGIDYKKHTWRTSESRVQISEEQTPMPLPSDLITKVKDRLVSRDDICLILEPGRSLVASTVTLVTKVIGYKENRDTKYVVVDGSMTEVLRPSLYGAYHHIELTEPVNHIYSDQARVDNGRAFPGDTLAPPIVLDNTHISPAVVDDDQISPAVVDDTQMSPAVVDNAQMSPSGVDDAQMSPALVDDAQMSPALVDDAQMSPVIVDDAQMSPAVVDDAQISPVVLDDAQTSPAVPDVEVSKVSSVSALSSVEAGLDLPRNKYDVVGPVCECADFLGKDRWLSRPHEGCGLAVFDAGAYCGSMASNYNLRMRPAEILVDGCDWMIIREPDHLDDLLRLYKY